MHDESRARAHPMAFARSARRRSAGLDTGPAVREPLTSSGDDAARAPGALGIDRDRPLGDEIPILFDRKSQRPSKRHELAQTYVAEFRLPETEITESELCGPTNYGESAAADPESPRTICGQCSP